MRTSRLGLAYQATGKTVPRAAFGIFYGTLGDRGNNDSGTANPPHLFNLAINSATTAPLANLTLANTQNPKLYSTSANYPTPMIGQRNIAAQRKLPGSATLTVAYVRSSTKRPMRTQVTMPCR